MEYQCAIATTESASRCCSNDFMKCNGAGDDCLGDDCSGGGSSGDGSSGDGWVNADATPIQRRVITSANS
jgi:hypothetical protein